MCAGKAHQAMDRPLPALTRCTMNAGNKYTRPNFMWKFYLNYSEGGFMERVIGDAHLLLVKPDNRSQGVA
jgi:hypothetical protein